MSSLNNLTQEFNPALITKPSALAARASELIEIPVSILKGKFPPLFDTSKPIQQGLWETDKKRLKAIFNDGITEKDCHLDKYEQLVNGPVCQLMQPADISHIPGAVAPPHDTITVEGDNSRIIHFGKEDERLYALILERNWVIKDADWKVAENIPGYAISQFEPTENGHVLKSMHVSPELFALIGKHDAKLGQAVLTGLQEEITQTTDKIIIKLQDKFARTTDVISYLSEINPILMENSSQDISPDTEFGLLINRYSRHAKQLIEDGKHLEAYNYLTAINTVCKFIHATLDSKVEQTPLPKNLLQSQNADYYDFIRDIINFICKIFYPSATDNAYMIRANAKELTDSALINIASQQPSLRA